MKTFSYNEFVENFDSVMELVNNHEDSVTIINQNGKKAILISLSHYNRLLETIHLLSSTSNSNHLQTSIPQIKKDLDV